MNEKELLSNKNSLEVMRLLPSGFKQLMNMRRFLPPQGYLSPNTVMVSYSLHVAVKMGVMEEFQEVPSSADGNIISMACWQALHGWPMFAVTPDLAEAMTLTDPPEDIKWGELQWPMPAMNFLLPDTPVLREHLMMGEVPSVISMGRLLCPPSNKTTSIAQLLGAVKMPDNSYTRDMLLIFYFDEKVGKSVMHDINAKHEWDLAKSWDPAMVRPGTCQGDIPFEPEDFTRMERTIKMGVNLLSFMTSTYRPETIEEMKVAGCIRPAKAKHKKPTESLYGVRWLGQGFKLKRQPVPLGGHHASPHWHWRKGFWRNQRHGPRLSLKKLIWLEPQIINIEQLATETT